jgi:hypothetical protein
MRGSSAVLLDASRASWGDFVEWMFEFRMATDESGLFAYVRPPAGCEPEARRMVRELSLSDLLQVIDSDAAPPAKCVASAIIARPRAPASVPPRPTDALALTG